MATRLGWRMRPEAWRRLPAEIRRGPRDRGHEISGRAPRGRCSEDPHASANRSSCGAEGGKESAANLWQDGDWVFAQPTGKAIDRRADYEQWRDLLKAADVRAVRLHDARHTAATMLLVLKVPTRAVMDVMGWSNASMAGRFQHVPIEVITGIAGKIGGLLWDTDGDAWGQPDDGSAGVFVPT